MPIICEHCKKPIESKADLIVMHQWWFFPKPLHKSCWGDLAMSHSGVGSVSYQTGMLQGKKQSHIAINSPLFTIIAVVCLILAIVILFADLSGAKLSSGSGTRGLSAGEQAIVKAILFVVLLIPLLQRYWSFSAIESKIPEQAKQMQ